uniref:Uncharacterized protein n=1 Tax=Pipistrellus kuhlii TaxID=59472 RepID=A0A7J7XBD3_PIPKU|nr:hypothetical protein mPipKuh1_010672 [Pipistrellus kuhlii]
MRHSLTPTAQDPNASASAGEPHAQGLSGDRRGAQDPPLSSPSLQDVPLLEVAGRHRQEARRWRACLGGTEAWVPPARSTLWAEARRWSCRDVWGILVVGRVGLSVSLSCQAQAHRSVVQGESSGWPWVRDPCPSLSSGRKLRRKM